MRIGKEILDDYDVKLSVTFTASFEDIPINVQEHYLRCEYKDVNEFFEDIENDLKMAICEKIIDEIRKSYTTDFYALYEMTKKHITKKRRMSLGSL